MADVKLAPDIVEILRKSAITGNVVKLPETLERTVYEKVNKALEACGGHWDRRQKGHVFPCNPRERLGLAIESGVAVDHQKKFQQFYTPDELAHKVIEKSGLKFGDRFLEPNAGQAAIASIARQLGAEVQCVELDPANCHYLRGAGYQVHEGDFLLTKPYEFGGLFDVVVMNPPFSSHQDIRHIQHAFEFLKPGGRLVAICIHNPNHTHFADPKHYSPRTKIWEQFAEWAQSASIEEVPGGTFEDTEVATIILTIDKPMTAETSIAGDRQSLRSSDLQMVLDSGTNAADVGKQQYFTPQVLADILTLPLANYRDVAVDLNMGAGALLRAAGGQRKLGVEIDSRLAKKPDHAQGEWSCVHADVTTFYPLLAEIDWRADLFVLNPPFSIKWHTNRLRALRESEVEAVRNTFRAGKETIDSTLATMLMALDRCSSKGEGLLICNESTAIKLFGDPQTQSVEGKPDGILLRKHIWLWFSLPVGTFPEAPTMKPCALYFAPSHHEGPTHGECDALNPSQMRMRVQYFSSNRWNFRRGLQVRSSMDTDLGTVEKWRAAHRELRDRDKGETRHPFNMWLENGSIRRFLTAFQECSVKIPKEDVKLLNDMHGKTPMSLVVAKDTRMALQRAVHSRHWKVDPALIAAVEDCVASYNSERAPFYPLNDVQRLGFLDESELITAKADWPKAGFTNGEEYSISCGSEMVERADKKINLLGEEESITLHGQELLIRVQNDDHQEVQFGYMDEKNPQPNRYSIHEFLNYFRIPEVKDLAQMRPEEYQENLRLIDAIQEMLNGKVGAAGHNPDCTPESTDRQDSGLTSTRQLPILTPPKKQSAFAFRGYQRDDLARMAILDGGILAWAPGLGKTMAMFTLPLLKFANLTLIVAPGALHEQIIEEGFNKFGFKVRRLDSQADFYSDELLQKAWREIVATGKTSVRGHWITTFTALGYNGGDEWEAKRDGDDNEIFSSKLLKTRATYGLKEENYAGIGIEANGVRCCFLPTLASLVRELFDCVVVDEAVRMKADDSYISTGVRRLNPKYRFVLTGTPIKNRLDDIFWLAHWAAGGHDEACARWPYANDSSAREDFANQHMVIERNHTAEAKLANAGKHRKIEKRTAKLCNLQRLWKLLCNIVIRRRKDSTGEQIVPKIIKPVRVMAGTRQREVYSHHLRHPPKITKAGNAMAEISQLLAQLTQLRQAACCPDSTNLGTVRSETSFTPKQAVALDIMADLLNQGEQVVLLTPFQHFSTSIAARLREAGVSYCLLDGRVDDKKRGRIAKDFKAGKYAVLIGGLNSMGEGHSFECCSNLIVASQDWAFDKNLQGEDRVHRLTSKKPVTIWYLVTGNSMDDQLMSLYNEKGDSSDLALDGRLFEDTVEEVSLGKLMQSVIAEFDQTAETMDEKEIEKQWNLSQRNKLRLAGLRFKEWHPPIVEPLFTTPKEAPVTVKEIRQAVANTGGLVAQPDDPVVRLAKGVPLATYRVLTGIQDETTLAGIRAAFYDFIRGGNYADWRAAWRAFDPPKSAAKRTTPTAPAIPKPISTPPPAAPTPSPSRQINIVRL